MIVAAKVGNLIEAFAVASRIVKRKEVIPVGQFAHVVPDGADGILLTATDFDISVRMSCQANVVQKGAMLIPAARFYELLRLLPTDAEVKLTTSPDKKHDTLVECRAYRGRIQALNIDDFPDIPKLPNGKPTAIFAADSMRAMISQTQMACGAHEQRYYTDGLFLTFAGGVASMVATDGRRLAISSSVRPDGDDGSVILPKKAADELRGLLDGDEKEVSVWTTENHTFMSIGDRTLISRVIDGQYPAFERIIPKENDKTLIVDRDVFSAAIRRVALVLNERGQTRTISFGIEKNALVVSGVGPDVGDASERIEAEYEGDDITLLMNSVFVLDFLGASMPGKVMMSSSSAEKAVLFEQSDDKITKYRYVSMPVLI